jgi:hypothetical protein
VDEGEQLSSVADLADYVQSGLLEQTGDAGGKGLGTRRPGAEVRSGLTRRAMVASGTFALVVAKAFAILLYLPAATCRAGGAVRWKAPAATAPD